MERKRSVNAGTAVVLTAAGCILYMVSGGIRGNFGILVNELAAHAGISYAQISFIAAVGQLMYGVLQPVFGVVALKKSNTFVLIAGAVMMAAGLLISALSSSYILLLIGTGLLLFGGTGAVCFGIIMGTLSPLLGKTRASAASGILNASSSVGISLLSPLMQYVQAHMGIVPTLLVLCVPILLLLPVIFWIARISRAYADDTGSSSADETAEPALTRLQRAVANPDYRRLMMGFSTCGFHMCIIQTHIYTQIVSYGIAESTAALAYTVFGITGMIGSVLCGFLCQRLPLKNVLGTLYGVRAVMVAVFLFLLPKTVGSVFFFIFILGMTGDATVTPTSEIVSRKFGAASLGFLFGITFMCHQVGGFLSSWLGGVFISASGNYTLIWVLDILVCAFASFVSYRITKEKQQAA